MITLTPDSFRAECRALADVVRLTGFRPDVVLGIATGGDYVAAEVAEALGVSDIASVRAQRPTTAGKQRMAGLIRRLPRWSTDLLRHAESRLLALRDAIRAPKLPEVRLGENLATLLKSKPEAAVLVVDDAVDSGATLAAVCDAIRRAAPRADLRTAVITLTRRKPLRHPDHYLHTELIRFPWSLDALRNAQ